MANEIGIRARAIRNAQGKSEKVIAELAGISDSYLHRLETGERAWDSISLTRKIANALRVSPEELIDMRLPRPADPDNETENTVRRALMAITHGHPSGEVQPVETLRARVGGVVTAMCLCEDERVGSELPGLIHDLHTTIAAGRDEATLLDLAVLLHTQATVAWLRFAGAPVDLCSQAAVLARRAAEQRDTPATIGLATASTARVLILAGACDLADAELDTVSVPTSTPGGMQLEGFRHLRRSAVAYADSRATDGDAALAQAADMANRTGEGNAFSLMFGPLNVGLFRMSGLLEAGDHERAVAIAESVRPDGADRVHQSYYFADYGRGLARIKSRREDAARAFLAAEELFPKRVHGDPFIRGVIAELVHRVKEDAVSVPLRGLAYRAGVKPVA